MSIDQFVSTNTGKKIGNGQCGDLVDLYLQEVCGNSTEYGSAKDYWFNGIPGFSVVSTPQTGDIVVYNAHLGYPDGHIAVYYNGEIFEQNANPDGSPAHLFPRATTYLLGYLRQGDDMSTLDKPLATIIAQAFYGNGADDNAINQLVGKESNTAIYFAQASPSHADYVKFLAGQAAAANNPAPANVKPYSGPPLFTKG